MAPTLIETYHKDLRKWPHIGATLCSRFGYLIASASLFKVSEHEIIQPEDDIVRYILIEHVGASVSDADLSNLILDCLDEEPDEAGAIRRILASGVIDESRSVTAARIGLRDYSFEEDDQSVDCFQVAGAFTDRSRHHKGIMSRTYLFLLNWYEHLVCDAMQTIPGALIWAGPMIRAGDVRIYNEKDESFVDDLLGERGKGIRTGFLPWNKGRVFDTAAWLPNELQITVQKFIVLIISRGTSIKIGFVPQDR